MRRLNIAVLDEELPFPLTSGKRIRTFNLLARLAPRHNVTVLCHRNPDRDEALAAEEAFRDAGIETVVVDRAVPSKSGPGFYARLAGNLLSPLPYSVSTHTSPALAEAARAFDAERDVDVWHCEWTPYAQVLRAALGPKMESARWTVMAHNVESLIWRRYAETAENPMKRWYIRQQLRKFERFERWAYAAATTAVAVSREDAALMRAEFGGRRVRVVENGVDVAYFRPQRDVERTPAQMLFMGSLDWRPNQDAAAQLLTHILPAVRAEVPHATAVLVGRRPPEWLRALAADTPGAELHADVPDVRPFLARCEFLTVPLRIGGGSRLKILEALAAGTPVVSTRVGAEGLELEPNRDLLVAETPEGMVNATLAAIRAGDQLQDTAESGRQRVLARYSWDLLAERLDDVWTSAVRQPAYVGS
ncbi:glycosyltransferase family 4 protein [Gemmata obscuriglobus]|uniref:Glycosyl transferase family 1 n=1 Tax=Gemmata obscuriglobus TaxID=114 RepID=A0A2Z3GZR7_9BACT|nr:glycosyltransferase family 4 protein [Gemmata obscuriglobus]AWM39263.1 glycosyl transferase family 1 [Gemmata obscuriglobus]VTS04883.1 Glycosyl transferase group 1 OS=Isosphaera pallida (strain ATCC 43644 / DSM 9630 / IS1B) GN=Isop_3197 PE=4 SV=1: Glyco_trans_4_4: Glyco_trans_1_4 [Gemmata obscuriglobus UQM 2246]